jgi:hypothetical protein
MDHFIPFSDGFYIPRLTPFPGKNIVDATHYILGVGTGNTNSVAVAQSQVWISKVN